MSKTVTIDGKEWTVLSIDDRWRTVAMIDKGGLGIGRQRRCRKWPHSYSDDWYTLDRIDPDETQALREMLATETR